MWSIKDEIQEVQYHINALRSIILGITMNGDSDPEIYRTLNYSLGILREKRESLYQKINKNE